MLSFILPAHDEAALLGDTLQALQRAADAVQVPCEIIVVNDASSDGTGNVAASHGARVLRVEFRHIAATRNAGARLATGQWLVFVDADTRVDAPVLRAAIAALRDGAVGGGARVCLQGPLRWFERITQRWLGWVFRVTGIAPGCFMFCTRTAFDAVGGFDEAWFAGEDVALSRALARQGRFVILREAVYTSARKLRTFSWREHLRLIGQFVLHGRGMLRSRDSLALWYGKRRDG